MTLRSCLGEGRKRRKRSPKWRGWSQP
jgi:hypothetical protein